NKRSRANQPTMRTPRTTFPLVTFTIPQHQARTVRFNLILVIVCFLAVGIPRSLYADPPYYVDGTTVSTTTQLTISPASPVQIIGSTVTLTSETSGVQKSGVTVSFYVDGTLIGTALTDASTQASLPFATGLLAEGQHTFRADFPDTVTATRLTGTHV